MGRIVERQEVGRTRGQVGQDARGSKANKSLLQLGRSDLAVLGRNGAECGTAISELGGGGENLLNEVGKETIRLGVGANFLRKSSLSIDSRVIGQKSKRLGTVNGEQVREETANVGRSHRGTRDGVARVVARVPGGENVETGGENVDAFTVVGKVGAFVTKGRGTDSNGALGTGGRVVAGVLVVAGLSAKISLSVESTHLPAATAKWRPASTAALTASSRD